MISNNCNFYVQQKIIWRIYTLRIISIQSLGLMPYNSTIIIRLSNDRNAGFWEKYLFCLSYKCSFNSVNWNHHGLSNSWLARRISKKFSKNSSVDIGFGVQIPFATSFIVTDWVWDILSFDSDFFWSDCRVMFVGVWVFVSLSVS